MEEVNKKEDQMYLVWEDLTVCSSNRKVLINGSSGLAMASRLMAIMGPSGSGKSTLLDALSGRLSPNVSMTGKVLLNGNKISTASKSISYITQEDHLLGTLTVQETLTYSAHLRLPSTMTKAEINQIVDETMKKLGLEDCSHTKVGNWHSRGISGGQKRRLSISLEMLTQPNVMFLDEPTSGLDSAAAFFVVQALRSVALDGKIVVCSIHQPSSFVFDLFDDLCLLSGGETFYFGEAKVAVRFYADSGFPCPPRGNPSDHYLRCLNSDFDKIIATRLKSNGFPEAESAISFSTQNIKEKLLEKYKTSAYSINTRKRIREIALVNVKPISNTKTNKSSWQRQLKTLTKRSFTNMTRDLGYYWIRIMFCILVTIATGIMFFDIGLSGYSILSRAKLYTYFFAFFLCLCVGSLPSIIEEWKVVYHERFNGHYGEGVFVLANYLSSLPFVALTAVCSVSILYGMVKFHSGISVFAYFLVNLYCCISVMESVTMIIALVVPNFLMGIGASAFVIMLLTMASGLYRPLPYLPKIFWRYPMTYISFTSWAVQGQYKNDMIGLVFEPLMPGEPKMEGERVLKTYFGVNPRQSKWWDLGALVLLLLLHKVVFFVALKYKERMLFVLRRCFVRRRFEKVNVRSSFRSVRVIPSKRHQPLHSLSSQEGLSSPLN